ncbi:MAG: response regulator [Desulfuromonadales bacterium]
MNVCYQGESVPAKKILVIDDDALFIRLLDDYIRQRFPALQLATCTDPLQGLAAISTDLDLLLIDLEMPGMDGGKILEYAAGKGLSRTKIVIFSGRDAEYLHQRFPMGSCLAVLNKFEVRQKAVLDMIFSQLQAKCAAG